jgi:hypothetical protein
MKNVAHASSVKAFLTTSAATGNFECATTTMTGELAKNSGTQIQINITTAAFSGTPAEPNSTHCTGPGAYGAMTMTPNHTTNPTHNGISSLPWCLTVEGAQDEFSIRGGKCSEAVRPLTFVYHSSVIGACTFSGSQITGTYTTHPADAIFTVQKKEFTRITGSAFCPGGWGMDWAFTMTTDGNNTPLYIS